MPGLNPRLVKALVAVLGLCVFAYILAPPLYWHVAEALVAGSASGCPVCDCDCSSRPLVDFPEALSSFSFTDCAKNDSSVSQESENDFTDLLSEELKLGEAQVAERQKNADMKLLEAKKLTSQYIKEADKCDSGMATCEEARERAEANLAQQKKLSAMWEMRAHQKGWKERPLKAQA